MRNVERDDGLLRWIPAFRRRASRVNGKYHLFSGRRIAGFGAMVLAAQLGLNQPAVAQQVNLEQAYQRMMDAGIEFGMIDADLTASAETVKQAKGLRLPRVEVTLQYDQIQQNVISSDNEAYATGTSQYPKVTMNFTVRQPLYDAVRFRALPLSKAQDAVRRADAEIARNRVVRDMIVAYFGVAQAQLKLDRAKAIVKGRSEYERSLQEDIDAGRREGDVLLRAESDTMAAESDAMDAEIGMAESLAELQRYVGPEVTGVVINGSRIGVVDLASMTSVMTQDNLATMSPDLQSARAAVDVANMQKRAARGALQPSLDLVLDFEQQTTEGSLFGGGSETQTMTGGVMLTVPVYEGGIKRSRVREADAGIKSAEFKLRQIELSVNARYKALMDAAKATASRSGKLSGQLRLSNESVQTAQEQFNAGRISEGILLEQKLRRELLMLDVQAARLQQLRVQTELYALFGAFDIKTISTQAGG